MNGYVKIDNALISTELSAAALRVFAALAAKRIGNSPVRADYQYLADNTQMSVSTVRRAVNELAAHDIIRKRNKFGTAGYAANLYYLKHTPLSGYFRLPRAVIAAPVSANTFKVYCYILARIGRRTTAFPSLRTISSDTGISRNTVIAAVDELKACRLISKSRRHYRKTHQTKAYRSNLYRLFAAFKNAAKKTIQGRIMSFFDNLGRKIPACGKVFFIFKVGWFIFEQSLTKRTNSITRRKRKKIALIE